MAGTHPKGGRFLKSKESLVQTRDAWLTWWKEKGAQFDLAKFTHKPRITGHMDIIEMDQRGYGQGCVVSIGPDLKEKWRITDANYPTAVCVANDGKIWIAESGSSRVTQRDIEGNVLAQLTGGQQPVALELLPDGDLLTICRNQIAQWNKEKKTIDWQFQRPNYDIMGGCRLTNGEILYVTSTNTNGENAYRLTAKGEDANQKDKTKRKLQFGRINQLQSMHAFAEDKVLVCEYDCVSEYDLNAGKQTWKYSTPPGSASSCQRLPNGNSLICLLNQNRLIEVDPSEEIVWEYNAKDGLRVGRAQLR
jgi:hypothetical protein